MNTVLFDEFGDVIPTKLFHPFNKRVVNKLAKQAGQVDDLFEVFITDHLTGQTQRFVVNDVQLAQMNRSVSAQRKAAVAAVPESLQNIGAWGALILTAVGVGGLLLKFRKRRRRR